MPGPCTVRPLNILHFLFYIQKQERPSHTLIFLFLFKNPSMQNLNSCKTHRFTELLVIRSPMPIYIRKKNVEIFKLYQNCRNDVQFNSSLRKKEKRQLFSFFFVFRFTNKQIQKLEYENLFPFSLFRFTRKNIPKNKKQKPTSVFRFSFYLQKIPKRTKNENRLSFLVLFTVQTNSCFLDDGSGIFAISVETYNQ